MNSYSSNIVRTCTVVWKPQTSKELSTSAHNYAVASDDAGVECTSVHVGLLHTDTVHVWLLHTDIVHVWLLHTDTVHVWLLHTDTVHVWLLHTDTVQVWLLHSDTRGWSRTPTPGFTTVRFPIYGLQLKANTRALQLKANTRELQLLTMLLRRAAG